MSSFDDPLTDRAFRLRIMAVDPPLLLLKLLDDDCSSSFEVSSSGWAAAAAADLDLRFVDIEQ